MRVILCFWLVLSLPLIAHAQEQDALTEMKDDVSDIQDTLEFPAGAPPEIIEETPVGTTEENSEETLPTQPEPTISEQTIQAPAAWKPLLEQLTKRVETLEREQQRFVIMASLRQMEQQLRSGQPYRAEWVQFRSLWLKLHPEDARLEWLEMIELPSTNGLPTQFELLAELHKHKGHWLISDQTPQEDTFQSTAINWLRQHVRLYRTAPEEGNTIAQQLFAMEQQLMQQQWSDLEQSLLALSDQLSGQQGFTGWKQLLQQRIDAEHTLQTAWAKLFTVNQVTAQ